MKSKLQRRLTFSFGLALACATALTPITAQAAPPTISNTSFSSVTETSAALQASVDPANGTTKAHFEYTTLAEFEAHGFQGASQVPPSPEAIAVPTQVTGSGAIQTGSNTITGVTPGAGAFGPEQTITAAAGLLQPETTITAVEPEAGAQTLQLVISKSAVGTASSSLSAKGPQPLSAAISGLTAASAYVFRAVAQKVAGAQEEAQGPPATFYTYGPAPTFSSCPNDDLRSGSHAAPGAPGALLPDCRAFELASPLEKNGNDIAGSPGFLRTADDGNAVTFGSTFGIPGGQGAQSLPFYQAARGEGGWTTSGLLPPASAGEEARFLVGQLPDLSATYATAERVGEPSEAALFEIHRDGTPPIQITPYVDVPAASRPYGFAGASADGSSAAFEAQLALPEHEGAQSIPNAPNVYSWDRGTGDLHLASVMNEPSETATLLGRGAYAGPYDWAQERLATGGGPGGSYYVTDAHAVSEDGSVVFTSRSTGHLYQRINPTRPQSPMEGDHCQDPALACTLDISATHRTPPDSAGEQPAAFQAATSDGKTTFFTSSEELTDDANTGPDQTPAQIGRATLDPGEGPASEVKEGFLEHTHALGLAVDPKGEYIYWADPSKETIGRAKLDGSGDLIPGSTELEFIVPGEVDFEVDRPDYPRPGFVHEHVKGSSTPRYVAVDEHHVYWTNTGPQDSPVEAEPAYFHGSIGRATLNAGGTPEDVRPAFILGASDPQGIAVDSNHVYWSNGRLVQTIARAPINGGSAEPLITFGAAGALPYALAVDAEHLYASELFQGDGAIRRYQLDGKEAGSYRLGSSSGAIVSLAVDGENLYWSSAGNQALGRTRLTNSDGSDCAAPDCQSEFLSPEGSLEGLAASGSHLFWSLNGESPKSPGTDLYRYQRGAAAPLRDLTPDSTEPNGAEVLGVLGASADGSHVYFAANGVLDSGPAVKPGDCHGHLIVASGSGLAGECNIYQFDQGQIHFIARVTAEANSATDATDWIPTPRYGAGFQKTSLVSRDGSTLIFRSQRSLTTLDTHGVSEFYRYRDGEGLICLTCAPVGTSGGGSVLGSLVFFSIGPSEASIGATQVRFASSDGNRFFFETPQPLVAYDTDGSEGCPEVGSPGGIGPSCLDVYEWEAPGSGSCDTDGPAYSPLNQGCIYLISQNTPTEPAFFAGVSDSGDDVFFITRAQLVRADTDGLRDVYDARVDGGLVSQNPTPPRSCEAEGCKPTPTPPPPISAPPAFSGPPDPMPKRCKSRNCRHHHKKHKARKHRHHHHRGPSK